MNDSWLPIAADSGFGIDNLPYGVFAPVGESARVGIAVGEHVLDLAAVIGGPEFDTASLNRFLAAGPDRWAEVRHRITELLTDERHRTNVEAALRRRSEVRLSLPFAVADFVDFYASEHHASNLGRLFRPDSEPLLPNWKHLPVGYHGRAGTVVASGTPVIRPKGQRKVPEEQAPTFGASRRLDIETEVGFVVGVGSDLGAGVPTADFAEHVFGVCLVNDWSARDIQAWEYVPLGPFLGKSFLTSISPWVVPLAALREARVPTPRQDPAPLPYLREGEPWGLDLRLEVELNGTVVSRPPYASTYWSPAQMLAHLTVNGASARTGDLFASGTVSGERPEQRGSFIEMSWAGSEPLELPGGSRTFLEDGDTVTIRGWAPGPGGARIGLGEVTGTVAPAV